MSSYSPLALGKVLEVLSQLLDVCHWHSIVVAYPDSTHATVAFETLQHSALCAFQEFLLGGSISSTKANVHSASDVLVRYDLVDTWIFIEDTVDDLGFGVCNSFLP